jgi:hypothetical protein
MPTTPTGKHLSHDERIEILALREEDKSHIGIARGIGCTERQLPYVCSINEATPRRGRGCHQKLSEDRLTSER